MRRRTFMNCLPAAAGAGAMATAAASDAPSRRQELYGLLGDLPPRDRPISAKSISTEQRDGFTLERLVLDLNGFEPVPAYFISPRTGLRNAPAILFNHWHGGEYKLGKDEMLRPKRGIVSYAESLTAAGYCALCIDHWLFGERSGRAELDLYKEMIWRGQVLWGMMVYDSLRALDYLTGRPEVNPQRVATLGMSMGSTMAWYLAALDERIKVCIDICCLTDFQALLDAHGLSGHGIYYYVPSLLKHFTTSQINALICPRPHLGLAGNLDKLTPVAGLDRIDREMKEVYAKAGVPDRWKLLRYDVAHEETPDGRRQVMNFLQTYL